MLRKNLLFVLISTACIGLAAFFAMGVSGDATPMESVQIMSGNYRKGGDEGVIGHLGGVPVSIPKEFAKFVEYDGDPGFLEKRTGQTPKRTFESGIRSFGFEVRYPDMAPENEVTWKEKRSKNIHNTTWIDVSILSNSIYQDRSLSRFAEISKIWLASASRFYHYEEQPKKVRDLTAYIPGNADLKRREMGMESFRDMNIYIHYVDGNGVDAYIDCHNSNHDAAPCKHRFDLGPGMKTSISVMYRKGLLPHWREIEDGVIQVVLGFRVGQPNFR
jgi:hypothetical protein